MQALARDILTDPDFKQGVAYLIKPSTGTGPAYNPGAGVAPTPILLPGCVAVGVPTKFIVRSLAIEGDLLFTSSVVAGVTVDAAHDKIRYNGNDYKIVSDQSVPPVGTKVVWKFIIRR